MGRLINKLNRDIESGKRGDVTEFATVTLSKADPGDVLSPYREVAASDGSFEVVFGFADVDGTLVAKDENDVTIVITAESLKQAMPYYEPRIKDKYLGTKFVAKIKNIDDASKTVEVVSGRSRVSTRERVIGELISDLKAGRQPEIFGRVVRATKDHVVVDILDEGLFGICIARNWQVGYTRDLESAVEKGQLLRFQVIELLPKKKNRPIAFNITHVPYTENMWEKIPKDLFAEGAVITVVCKKKPSGKSYWWGSSNLLPGIDIVGSYNNNREETKHIKVGVAYKCKVKTVDPVNQRFSVKPFAVATQETGTKDAVTFLMNRKEANKKKEETKKEDKKNEKKVDAE